MKLSRSTTRFAPLLLVIFTLLASVLAQDHGQPQADRASRSHIRGASSYEEASAILRKIKPAGSRLSTFTKPTGMLGTMAYYGKELFYLLFMNAPPESDLVTSQTAKPKLSKPLVQAVKLLEESAGEGNEDAIQLLAEINFFGNYSHPRNYTEAMRRYSQLALIDGNSTAQHMLGFMYATGIGGAAKQDQAKALLYHTFAAKADNTRSQMTVAFRHQTGIGTPRNCEEAVYWYKRAADKVMKHMKSGPPGGHYMYKKGYRIADVDGGVYGEGASVSSSGVNAKTGGPNSDAYAAFEDIIEYLELMHRKGDLGSTYNLGRLYYDGSRELKQDFKTAKTYFFTVAKAYWTKEGKVKPDASSKVEKLASTAAGYIGRMFLRGEGVNVNYELAQAWFKRGIANGDSLCQYQMGLMYLMGVGVERDAVKAADLFAPAADQDMASAQAKLGTLFLDQGDVQTATKYFELAERHGNIEAYYYLAEMANQGIGRERSCSVAASFYKIVSERGESIVAPFEEANAAYESGDRETALVDFMMAAELGFEVGQANVAYLLDQARPRSWSSVLSLGSRPTIRTANDELALIYWTRSAKQMNIDSNVKMGDYYLEGLGTRSDKEKAAICYQAAAETMKCSQAMWNLGWMHENGIGLEQDFHLAKRYYDLALETNPHEAYLPVTLALYKLRLRSWWNDMTNGDIKSIQGDPEPEKEWTFSDWFARFLKAGDAYYDDYLDGPDDYDLSGDHDGFLEGDDLYDDIDDGILESLLIVSLAAVLAFLVYYRQQRQVAERRDREQRGGDGHQNGQGEHEPDRGVFPRPDEPEFVDWAVGGVGH